jgi:polyisoprenoid-binding protein YceI
MKMSQLQNKIVSIITLQLLLFVFTADLEAQSYMTEEGFVEFKSSAPLLTFKGTSNHLTGLIDLDQNMVDFYVDLNTLDTGINLRNRHMRNNYLETDKYPFAEFTGSMNLIFDPESTDMQEVMVIGEFTIHGVTREMEITGTLQRADNDVELNASWTVLLEDHNIDRPGVIFYELAEEQEVTIKALLKLQND